MSSKPVLVLGTGNRKKCAELIELLSPLGLELKTLADFPAGPEVVEDGETFAANAAKKASEQARRLGHWVLGEDSGLGVDALDGAPGVYSARFAGPQATDADNNRLLLERLTKTPNERRTAYYVCHAVVADPQGALRAQSEARCRGRIRREPVGTAGFGYDPLFEIVEYHRTFAELGETVKARLSHRARAIEQIYPQLARLLDQDAWQ